MDLIRLYSGGFPLTTNRLEFLQQIYAKAFSQFAKLAGDGNLILDGVVKTGTNISSGVIIINDEIIEFRGGSYDARVAIFEDVVTVPYNEDLNPTDGDLDLKISDVVKFAKCASSGGVDPFNFSTLERIGSVKTNSPIIGEKKEIFGSTIPTGWLLCNGATLNAADEPRLFAEIGTTYGSDGAGTFKLPDNRNRGTKGAGDNYNLGDTGGFDEVAITEAQMPAHKHTGTTVSGGSHSHYGHVTEASGTWRGGGNNSSPNSTSTNGNTQSGGSHSHSLNINNKGGGAAHENRSPFVAVNVLIFKGY